MLVTVASCAHRHDPPGELNRDSGGALVGGVLLGCGDVERADRLRELAADFCHGRGERRRRVHVLEHAQGIDPDLTPDQRQLLLPTGKSN